MDLILLHFNNYFNRKLKKLDSVDNYLSSDSEYVIFQNFNFNPNDGVETEVVVGAKDLKANDSFDYLLVCDLVSRTIDSRWFIIESVRTRNGQYRMSVKRDILVDEYDNVVEAPIYIEKAIINDPNSPLLFNNESLQVNQIKKREILLKDKTNVPWLVMYIKKGVIGDTSIDCPINFNNDENEGIYVINTPITNWEYYGFTNESSPLKQAWFYSLIINFYDTMGTANVNDAINKAYINSVSRGVEAWKGNKKTNLKIIERNRDNVPNVYNDYKTELLSLVEQTFSYNNAAFSVLQSMVDKGTIIKDSQGKYFKVSLVQLRTEEENKTITQNQPTLFNRMKDVWNEARSLGNEGPQDPNNYAFEANVDIGVWQVVLDEQFNLEANAKFGDNNTFTTLDVALYDVIALPYGNCDIKVDGSPAITFNYSKQKSLAIMNSIALQLTSSNVLDLQLLPYCPFQQSIDNHKVVLSDANSCVYVKDGDDVKVAAIPVVQYTTFTFYINKPITIDVSGDVPSNYKMKYLNDCTSIRLCSPNYNGLFEMNLARNGGSIHWFNVDVTLKPINPYIHVNPDFNYLYGRDFDDARGLILGGDFGLGIIDDAWKQYEIQNKNYQAIFDRQIQNIDVNSSIAKQEARWGIAAGTIGAGASGAASGAMVGGVPGAIIGGVAGAGASLAGGIVDYQNIEKRVAETKDFALDNFNLSLQNIKALPYSITRTNALTANNKLFPFVEIYECTETEKEAYFNKLKYDGMSVGVIGKMSDYETSERNAYFKGKLIRSETIKADSHVLNAIYIELMKGVYI